MRILMILTVVALYGLVGTASAADKFQWRGEVDGSDEIEVRGSSVRVRHLEAQPIQNQDHRFSAPLPRDDVRVSLKKIDGRGKIRLVEQPTSRNDYTAVVRIEDDKGGSDKYEFELSWDDDWDDRDRRDSWSSSSDSSWNSGSSSSWGDDRGREESFRWRGRVDIGAEIEIHGNQHRVKDEGGSGTQERRHDFSQPLPRSRVAVSLHKTHGRGKVRLVQSPSSSNNYTAIVKIEDDKGGADDYEFELTWRE